MEKYVSTDTIRNMNRNKILSIFQTWVQIYDASDPKIQLKIIHTYHVANLCDHIAHALGLSEEECDFAWYSGLLHDIGRFEQLRIYHTFLDAKSINHAHLGAELFAKSPFVSYVEDVECMKQVIYLHNALDLPTMDEKTQRFCDILRDADKIDILRVNQQSCFEDIYDIPEASFYTTEVTHDVMESVKRHVTLDRSLKQTAIDHVVGHISFVFGLVYYPSIEIVQQQGYLDALIGFESKNPKAREQFAQIRKEVDGYIQEKKQSYNSKSLK